MMVCPILQDELLHNLTTDQEQKNIFLIDDEFNETVIPRLVAADLDYTVISRDTFLNGLYDFPKDEYNVIIWMMDMGLHEEPENLKNEIRKLMLMLNGLVDGAMLYYGLCGRGLENIESWGKENLKFPMTIFKDSQGRLCDDCICVPLGSTDNYLRLLKKHAGIMYLTPGVACNFEQFMDSMDLFKGIEKGDREMFKMILDMAGYTQAMKIQTGLGDQENFQKCCEEYVKKYELELIELEDGWTSTEVADRTYAEAKGFLAGPHIVRAA